MPNEKLCRLCRDEQAIEVELETSMYKSANNLLQRLFGCYNIDVSILGESSFICKQCFEWVLRISESLEKWSKAQEVLKARPLDIDDSKAQKVQQKSARSEIIDDHKEIPVVQEPKTEPTVLWDENDDAEFLAEDDMGLLEIEAPKSDDLDFFDEEEPQTEDVEFRYEEEPQTDDMELIAKEPSEQDYEELFGSEEAPKESAEPVDWRSTPHEFFCVCLGIDGLALTVLFKDKTTKRKIWMLCTCCNQVFSTMTDIRKHSSRTRAHPEYWCRSCGIYFSSISALKVHENYRDHKLKTSGMVIRCLKCAKISTQFSNAVRHENIVHEQTSYECKKCKVYFNSREFFEKHQWKHNSHIQCRYPKCQRYFTSWEQYASHLSRHKRLPPKDVPYLRKT